MVPVLRRLAGQHDARVPPVYFADGLFVLAFAQLRGVQRRGHHDPTLFIPPRKRHDVLGVTAFDLQRHVESVFKNIFVFVAQFEQRMGEPQLDSGVATVLPKRFQKRFGLFARKLLNPLQRLIALLEIHRPAVVGIHQAQVPRFAALVHVRHAGACKLQQHLRERIHDAMLGDFFMQRFEAFPMCALPVQQLSRKRLGGSFVRFVWL